MIATLSRFGVEFGAEREDVDDPETDADLVGIGGRFLRGDTDSGDLGVNSGCVGLLLSLVGTREIVGFDRTALVD